MEAKAAAAAAKYKNNVVVDAVSNEVTFRPLSLGEARRGTVLRGCR